MFTTDFQLNAGKSMESTNGYANTALTPSGGITEKWYYQDRSAGWTN